MAASTTLWFDGFAPDASATARRFPVAIVFAALATAAALGAINESAWLDHEGWMRLFVGLASGAVCAVAGTFVVESRPRPQWLGLFALYGIPLLPLALAQIRDVGWVAPPLLLPLVALLWLSVSPVTAIGRGDARAEQQDRFWWMNNQAIATALVAGTAFVIICVGVAAIERSLSYLFGIESGAVLYRWILPVTGLFLTPVYWLSTLPKAADYVPAQLERLEIVSRAVGFLGQFVLVPLLAIYAAILLAYTAQIVVTQTLPQGMIGWMVLGFVVTGAAAWLMLHPPFMRTRGFVRLFRRVWFWLTIPPLALFFLAVWVRVDAYGLTDERVLLTAGGVWAALLAAVFLAGRGDIRLIPALGGAILLVLTVGPWNFAALPIHDQAGRLSRLLAGSEVGPGGAAAPQWDAAELAAAQGAIQYLFEAEEGRAALRQVLFEHGVGIVPTTSGVDAILTALGQDAAEVPGREAFVTLSRSSAAVVDVSATPFHLGRFEVYRGSRNDVGLGMSLDAGVLELRRNGAVILSMDTAEWASGLGREGLEEPWLDLEAEAGRFRLVLSSVSWEATDDGTRLVTNLSGELFSNQPDVTPN